MFRVLEMEWSNSTAVFLLSLRGTREEVSANNVVRDRLGPLSPLDAFPHSKGTF